MPGFAVGKRHTADMNQKIAEPHAAIMIPASTYDLIITPHVKATAAVIYSQPELSHGLVRPQHPTIASGMSVHGTNAT